MAKSRRRKGKGAAKMSPKAFWAVVIGCSMLASLCALITLGSKMENPIFPTWKEIGVYLQDMLSPNDDGSTPDGTLEIHVLDVGNADCILLRSETETMLIDAGENNDGDNIVHYLREKQISRLDYVIATHADADHIGGMKTVIQQMEIGKFIMAFMPDGFTPTTSTYAKMLEALADKNIKITPAETGSQFPLGEAAVYILGPAGEFEDKNNMSVVCKVVFGQKKFLFMGDAEKEAENALLQSGCDLTADVLKIGHHGSSSSTTHSLLKAVHPSYALITCGKDNSYGHPHKETIENLQKAGISIYRSDINGTIVLTTDGESIEFTTQR